jgi:hypothetical protein
MVIFENDGEIDPRLISSFGVNVKEGEGAIGFFGTGLKYALAILLRSKHRVTIQSGRETFAFDTQPTTIRGKQFDFVAMNRQPLGFTTEVGKTWKMWMAYRELFCNCQDEGGRVYESADAPEPVSGKTRVLVEGEEFVSVRRNHGRYFVTGSPLWEGDTVAIHEGRGTNHFFRGVAVAPVPEGQSLYRYNFKSGVDLTEDRTAKDAWMLDYFAAFAILNCDDAEIIRTVVTAPKGTSEHEMKFDSNSNPPGESFLRVVGDLVRAKWAFINPTAIRAYEKHARTKLEPERASLDEIETKMLGKAVEFCRRFGFDLANEIVPVENIGPGVLGMARNDRIYVAREAFNMGTKVVAGTLIEEHIHLRYSLPDCSRAMQEHLLNRLVSAGERITGEPL